MTKVSQNQLGIIKWTCHVTYFRFCNFFLIASLLISVFNVHTQYADDSELLESLAKTGYLKVLNYRPQLRNVFFKSNNKELAQSISQFEEISEMLFVPIRPMSAEISMGLGNSEDRRRALQIISSRKHYNPEECNYWQKGLVQ